MSFIGAVSSGQVYAPGWFLADDEDCTRITITVDSTDNAVETAANGGKYMPMGTVYEGGILYEDVDVTDGDMPGSLVIAGHYYADRVNGDTSDITYTGLIAVTSAPTVTRPDFNPADPEGATGATGAT